MISFGGFVALNPRERARFSQYKVLPNFALNAMVSATVTRRQWRRKPLRARLSERALRCAKKTGHSGRAVLFPKRLEIR
jgi:hypothetical protein